MILIIYLFTFIACITLSYLKYKKIFNILSLFTTIWLGFGFLSSININDIRLPSIYIHLFICIFVLTSNFIVFLFKKKIKTSNLEYKINDRTIKFAITTNVLSVILMIPLIITSFNILLNGGTLTNIRDNYFGVNDFTLINKTITLLILEVNIILFTYVAFKNKKYMYLLLSLFNVILSVFTNGGRYTIMLFFYTLLILFIDKVINFNIKNKRKMIVFIVILILFMSITTLGRGQNFFKSIISYFSGSFSFLDYIFEYPTQFGLENRTFGYLTFSVITEPIVLFLKLFNLTNINVPQYEFNIYCQGFYNIGINGNVMMFNNNTSILYHFIRDFGVWGPFVGAIILFSIYCFVSNRQKKSLFFTLFYIYFTVVIFNSIMTFQMFSYVSTFYILYMILLSFINSKKHFILWR